MLKRDITQNANQSYQACYVYLDIETLQVYGVLLFKHLFLWNETHYTSKPRSWWDTNASANEKVTGIPLPIQLSLEDTWCNLNKRAQRALGRSPEEKVKGHSKAIYRGPLMLSTKYW